MERAERQLVWDRAPTTRHPAADLHRDGQQVAAPSGAPTYAGGRSCAGRLPRAGGWLRGTRGRWTIRGSEDGGDHRLFDFRHVRHRPDDLAVQVEMVANQAWLTQAAGEAV
jgi:hypothetical protein